MQKSTLVLLPLCVSIRGVGNLSDDDDTACTPSSKAVGGTRTRQNELEDSIGLENFTE